MQRLIQSLLMFVIAIPCVAAVASTTGILPAGVCAHPDTIYMHGFEAQSPRYVEPSNGSGAASGGSTRTVSVPGFGIHRYYSYVPSSYDPTRPMPMLMLLHGTGGRGTAQMAAYALIYGTGSPVGTVPGWKAVAEAAQIIIVAPIGSGSEGGWVVPLMPSDVSDYDAFRAIFADMKSAYNIDGSRIHGWGYSSGGSVMNDLIFGQFTSPGIDINTFAGLGNWAGGLDGLVCDGDEPACVQAVASLPRMLPIELHVGVNDDASRPHVLADYNRFQNAGWLPEFNLWHRVTENFHEYDPYKFPEIWDHLCPFQRLP